MRYLIIDNNVIVNIVAATPDYAQSKGWPEAPDAVAIGWSRSGPSEAWKPGESLDLQEYPRFLGNEKLDLFTPQEQMAVVTATMTDPMVKLMYDRLLGARYWTYEDPETERGLALLEAKELITAERKAQIVQQMLAPNWPISSQ